MEYAVALEDKSTHQEGCILGLEASLGANTTFPLPTKIEASAVTSTAATKLAKMKAMMKSLAASTTVLSSKITTTATSGGGGRTTTSKNGMHICKHCKRSV